MARASPTRLSAMASARQVFPEPVGPRNSKLPIGREGLFIPTREVPVTGERKNVKILGAIELWRTRFDYRQDTVFNATTYLGFLEQLARRYRRQGAILIQDNASYHKDAEVWAW